MELLGTVLLLMVLFQVSRRLFKHPVHWLSKEGETFVSSGVKFAAKHTTVTMTMCGGKQLTFTAKTDLVTCKTCRRSMGLTR